MPLQRQIYLDRDLVKARAREYRRVADLLGARLTEVLEGKRKRADAVPLLLRLLEQTGEGSAGMLARFEQGLAWFDEVQPDGWTEWKSALPGADRPTCLSRYTELLVALAFSDWGYKIEAFEPPGATGKLADLLTDIGGERVFVEITNPGPRTADWVEAAMDHLSLGLSRVASGLTIEVRGYEALSFDPARDWGARNRAVTTQEIEDVINEFCRKAQSVDLRSLPQVVVEPRECQPVTITVVAAGEEVPERTYVKSSWNRSGLVPNVERLVERVLAERGHLPADRPGIVLVDLRMWPDFWYADVYLRKVASKLTERSSLPVLVGTFVSDSGCLMFERRVLHAGAWVDGVAGSRFLDDWCGGDPNAKLQP